MLSKSNARKLQRKFDNERRMSQWQQYERNADFVKRLGKAIGVGLFSYITMVTGQVAGWIAVPLIGWSLCYGACEVDRYMEWRCAPWQH